MTDIISVNQDLERKTHEQHMKKYTELYWT